MPKWWDTSKGAWGLLTIGVGVGVVLSLISPQVGIPVGVIITLAGIVLVIRAYREKAKSKEKFLINNETEKENVASILEKLRATGRLEDISQGDAYWIVAKSIEMTSFHGHNDLLGLLADRASNVPLNKLMTNPCSKCGIPRNQRGKNHG